MRLAIVAIVAIALAAIALSGCLEGPQGPPGPQGDAGPAGAFVQGPNRVVVYQNYLLLDPLTGGNGTLVAKFNGTGAATTNSTGYMPDYPRNAMLNRTCDGTGAFATCTSGSISVTIYGVDIATNANRSETLSIPTNRSVVGNIAWYNVTKIVWGAATGNESLSAGWGAKFGLPNLFKSNVSSVKNGSDILGVTVSGTGRAVSTQTWNLTYNTVQFSTAPDASIDYVVFYRGYGVIPP